MDACLQFTWLRAGEALTSLASIPSKTMLVARSQSQGSHATSTLASNWSEGSSEQGPTDETFARGSSESPCRFFFSVAALLSTVAVKLLLEVKKRSTFSSPTEKTRNNTTTQTGKGELK